MITQYPIASKILDAAGNVVSDSVNHSIVTSDIEHYLEHIGRAWVYSDTASVNAGANLDILITNGASGDIHIKDYHFTSTQANATIILYGSTTTSAAGTAKTLRNKNLNYQGNTPQSSMSTGPTVTGVGNILEATILTGNKQSGGSIEGNEDEWIIPASTKAMFRFTNNSASTDSISFWIKILDVAGL